MPGLSVRRLRAPAALALVAALTACAEESPAPVSRPAPAADSFALTTPEEIRAEIEMLGYEMADLETYLAAHPTAFPSDSVMPGSVLATAHAALAAVEPALAAADTARALDSLSAAAGHIERVKRILGVAEEWGVELDTGVEVGAWAPGDSATF